jgi:hypothetical protein
VDEQEVLSYIQSVEDAWTAKVASLRELARPILFEQLMEHLRKQVKDLTDEMTREYKVRESILNDDQKIFGNATNEKLFSSILLRLEKLNYGRHSIERNPSDRLVWLAVEIGRICDEGNKLLRTSASDGKRFAPADSNAVEELRRQLEELASAIETKARKLGAKLTHQQQEFIHKSERLSVQVSEMASRATQDIPEMNKDLKSEITSRVTQAMKSELKMVIDSKILPDDCMTMVLLLLKQRLSVS